MLLFPFNVYTSRQVSSLDVQIGHAGLDGCEVLLLLSTNPHFKLSNVSLCCFVITVPIVPSTSPPVRVQLARKAICEGIILQAHDETFTGPFQDRNISNAANDSPKPVQAQRGNVSSVSVYYVTEQGRQSARLSCCKHIMKHSWSFSGSKQALCSRGPRREREREREDRKARLPIYLTPFHVTALAHAY